MTKILIIDDEKNIRNLIGDFIHSEFKVERITYAEDAFSAFHEMCLEKYDLICLDHHMPFFSGGDFLNVFRAKPGVNRNTPVIFVSAFIPELPKNLQGSMDLYYLEKPIDMERFCRYIKMILNKKIELHI